jgi:hypothetical protein
MPELTREQQEDWERTVKACLNGWAPFGTGRKTIIAVGARLTELETALAEARAELSRLQPIILAMRDYMATDSEDDDAMANSWDRVVAALAAQEHKAEGGQEAEHGDK